MPKKRTSKPAKRLAKKAVSAEKQEAKKNFPIVAIGASLGGLKAFTVLLENLDTNTGMAFIYVQHLDPTYKSSLPSFLAKSTEMKVQNIDDMELMKPNNVYVIPYDKIIKVTDGHIKLLERPKNSSIISIDVLFSSLADTHKENTIGVILSGHAKDGSLGISAIKKAGGITMAQDSSAEAGSMPKSAIATGDVDFILSPKRIAKEISRISKTGELKMKASGNADHKNVRYSGFNYKTVFEILRRQKGIDFSHYKMATINRRIQHRMGQCHILSVKTYVKFLIRNPKEVDLLYNDCLINVTSFFRDADTFKYLKNFILPKILKSKTEEETLRIWIPACSTGQEVYSVAMLLIELQDSSKQKIPVKIFATDLSDSAIHEARIAEYQEQEIKHIPAKYVKRFFTRVGKNYRIIKEIREICTFAPHNILSDPPFFKVDFISCRNLLIYFDPIAQKKVLGTLHFALSSTGYLLLGKSETTGTCSSLYTQVNSKYKFYLRKKDSGARKLPDLIPNSPRVGKKVYEVKQKVKKTGTIDSNFLDGVINNTLLENYMPACAIINGNMDILQFRGLTSEYLSHPSGGRASLNILKMARPEFAFELRSAIHQVFKTKQKVHKSGIELKIESGIQLGSTEVSMLNIEWDEPLLLVVFTLHEKISEYVDNSKRPGSVHKDLRIKKLISELAGARLEMDSIIEAQETSYEELQSANEEIVSSNEEFQTLNEELETSKEEIEATNEELISTNQELKTQNDLLAESYNYSEAIIATIHEAMLILDYSLLVKSANKSYYKKFSATKTETEGKSLFKLGKNMWDNDKLHELLRQLISKNHHFENFELASNFHGEDKILLINANRIVQKTHNEKLILLAIKDITEVRKMSLELQLKEKKILETQLHDEKKTLLRTENSEKRYNMLIMKSPFSIAILKGKDMIISLANNSMKELWGKGKYIEGKALTKVLPELKGQAFPDLLDKVYSTGVPFYGNEMLALINHRGRIRHSYYNFIYQPYLEADESISGVTIIAYDVTAQVIARKQSEKAHIEQKDELEKAVRRRTRQLEQKNIELESANKGLTTFTYVSSHDLQEPLRKIQNFVSYILKKENKNLSEEGKGYFNRMQETAKRMQALIEDLLTYSQAKSTELKFEKTKLSVIIDEVKKDFEEIIIEKKAKFKIGPLGEINILPSQFRQLMHNLIGNSLKFSKQNVPPHITISTSIEKGKDLGIDKLSPKINYCHIIFTDNGIGFDPKYQDRIFEVFQRLHSYEEYKGTGIGLAICKRIIENHNGVIKASGKLNKGARFDIYVPA